ncbi:MAG: endonuclease/exonuclease/phosphatase family protein, partial [Trebonia sp.]
INTHPVASRDGDWSRTGRFYELHRAQLAAITAVVQSVEVPAVVCGDFNVDRDSDLFGSFAETAGLADVFEGSCPPTFRREYLPAGEEPHCIDFILTGPGLKAESAEVLFGAAGHLASGPAYVSDHVGLKARMLLTSP